ncbi:primary-amine oxidase [Pseudonocardiaceae bacterium YIM PH 21723]|nr:primary-amine oxidase [Pseudonocardiaceae bacterium YIM PH 21723]
MHPLDPLTEQEIRTVADVARHRLPDAVFSVIRTSTVDKEQVRSGERAPRRASAVLAERADRSVYEIVVDLPDGGIRSWQRIPGMQATLTIGEIMSLGEIVLAEPAAREALLRHGVTEPELVQFDPWPIGEQADDRRLVRVVSYVREFEQDNGYARPIGNLIFVVDLDLRRVVTISDGPVLPLPPEPGNYDAALPKREGLRPLEISQPAGPSFTMDGNVISWQHWRLHAHIDPVEGLVIGDVRYQDRSIMYRAALAEMVVPYGDPHPDFRFRAAFDARDYHLGRCIAPLEPGCDCLGEIRYLDAVIADELGDPQRIRNAICVHEEDAGIAWKHWNFRWNDRAEVRRGRRLVVSTICTVGNYEYGFYWYFHTDGRIEHEVKLTGIVQTRALDVDEEATHGTLVAPGLSAPLHQHLFCMRLDMEVDGPHNTVSEVDFVPLPPGPDNPTGTAFTTRSTPITSEAESARRCHPGVGRRWTISNPGSRNRLGHACGYTLIPTPAPTLLAHPTSEVARRAVFATAHLWVTRYSATQLHPAGEYLNQPAGLPQWIDADRALEDTDVVLWHTFGPTHEVRSEDWPVMPVDSTGFTLRPTHFFDRNPGLDLP